jgi:hypothetical protein
MSRRSVVHVMPIGWTHALTVSTGVMSGRASCGNRVGFRHVRFGPLGSDPGRWRFRTRKRCRLCNTFSTVLVTRHQGTDFNIRLDETVRSDANSMSRTDGRKEVSVALLHSVYGELASRYPRK